METTIPEAENSDTIVEQKRKRDESFIRERRVLVGRLRAWFVLMIIFAVVFGIAAVSGYFAI